MLRAFQQHPTCQGAARLSFTSGLKLPDLVVEEALKFFDLGGFELCSVVWSHVALRQVAFVLVLLEGLGVLLLSQLAQLTCSLKRCFDIHSQFTPKVTLDLVDGESSPCTFRRRAV